MTRYNLKDIDIPAVSLNFADLASYKDTLKKFKAHLEEKKNEKAL
jgi:hypothetical protein